MKIALIGSAPSSINLAPYGDPEWQIWGCSPGAYGVAGPHAHQWFELHRWEPQVPGHVGTGKPWFSPEYVEFMTRFKGVVWMADPAPEIPNARKLDVMELTEEFGPYFWTSSLSYMWAMALMTPGVEEIAMFGVDMAAHEEYALQRPACQYFITLAVQRGIKVTIPPESDILQPTMWYGVSENHPMMVKLTARQNELLSRKAAADQRLKQAEQESLFLAGALDDVKYMIDTWVTQQAWIEPTMNKTGNEVRANADPRKEFCDGVGKALDDAFNKSMEDSVFHEAPAAINVKKEKLQTLIRSAISLGDSVVSSKAVEDVHDTPEGYAVMMSNLGNLYWLRWDGKRSGKEFDTINDCHRNMAEEGTEETRPGSIKWL